MPSLSTTVSVFFRFLRSAPLFQPVLMCIYPSIQAHLSLASSSNLWKRPVASIFQKFLPHLLNRPPTLPVTKIYAKLLLLLSHFCLCNHPCLLFFLSSERRTCLSHCISYYLNNTFQPARRRSWRHGCGTFHYSLLMGAWKLSCPVLLLPTI